jgi:hypothetical protein
MVTYGNLRVQHKVRSMYKAHVNERLKYTLDYRSLNDEDLAFHKCEWFV